MAAGPPPSVFVVVPAAGEGRRLGRERKASVPILGEPLVVWTLRALVGVPGLRGGALVVHPEDLAAASGWLSAGVSDPGSWQVVPGGATRQESVERGFRAQGDGDRARLALVHDAARPLLHPADRDRVVAEADRAGAAILARPVADTLWRAPAGVLEARVDRAGMWRAETPQVVLSEWFEDALEAEEEATDEAGRLFARGRPVRVVAAEHPNLKVTRPEDLQLAAALLRDER